MNLRVDWRGYRFYIALTHSKQVQGVNSRLPNGKHFLMWDFDNVHLEDVMATLTEVQKKFELPTIYILNTGLEFYWHAYCFKAMDWGQALFILASTKYLDPAFFKIGCIRGYFTLRFSPKKNRHFSPATILPSHFQEDVDPYKLDNFVQYWTKRI